MAAQLSVLVRQPLFRRQFTAHAISSIGSSLSPVALTLGVLQLHGSKADLGLILAAGVVPLVMFLLVGGVWADRLPRHRLMCAADTVRTATQLTSGVILLAGHTPLWALVALEFVRGTATALYYPAATGLTPLTVHERHLQPANALLSMANSLSGSLGPLAAATLVVTAGPGWALVADAATFAVSATLLAGLRVTLPPKQRQSTTDTFLSRLRTGFREVVRRRWVSVSILGFAASHVALGVFFVLGPSLLGTTPQGVFLWGSVVAALGIGQLIGDIIALRARPSRPLLVAKLAELLPALLLVAVAVRAPDWVTVVAAAGAGIGLSLPDALWFTALQQHLPSDVISRVSSYDWMGSLVLRPVGYGVAAGASTALGDGRALIVGALLILSTRVLALGVREVRALPGYAEQGRTQV